jgi:hypothetical protein
MLRALLAFVLALPSAAAPESEPHWRVHVEASGGYAVDYGAEGDAVDGQSSGSWSWELKAVAAGYGIDTGTATFRMSVGESSSIVLAGATPYCRPPASDAVGWVRDPRVGLYFSPRARGFQVDHPFGGLLAGCHAGAHGMTLYDGAVPAATRLPRGAFRPRRDRAFERTWTQSIALDRSHDPGEEAHGFTADGTLTLELRRISSRAARALRLRLRSTPRTPPS